MQQIETQCLGGQPLVTKGIFSFLNPADLCSSLQVCRTWNNQVSCGARFMNKVSIYRRQCKENVENLHKTEEPIYTTVFPNKRRPLADFTPNIQSQFQTAKPASPASFTSKCMKPWHKGSPSLLFSLLQRGERLAISCVLWNFVWANTVSLNTYSLLFSPGINTSRGDAHCSCHANNVSVPPASGTVYMAAVGWSSTCPRMLCRLPTIFLGYHQSCM